MRRPIYGSARALAAIGLAAIWLAPAADALAANDAAFDAQTVPASVTRGSTFQVEIRMRNTGDTTWSLAAGHFLGSENPRDNFTWGTNRIWLNAGDSVPPGATHTFTASLTAPAAPGDYDFQWQMLQDAVEWFGAPSANLRIQVTEPSFTCDGSEVLCLQLTSAAEVTGSGGTVVGGDFAADGFMPHNQGGLDWTFGPGLDFSSGELEVIVTGLQPLPGGEQDGGKVSIFAFCGLAPEDNESIGLQKMAEDYRDGHIFRYGQDDDGLADNWDAVVITGAGFGCYYSIADPAWQPGEAHTFRAAWSPAGLDLWIDDTHCAGQGNGDAFDPAQAVFTLANRCTHYANQQAIARFSNLRLWALGTSVCGDGDLDPGETCDGDCPASCDDADPCTTDSLTGSPDDCDAACVFAPVVDCIVGDGCCPAGCGLAGDPDCPDQCGDGDLDPGETCDGDCPASCDDADPCTADSLTGSPDNCDAVCVYSQVMDCITDDGCCPPGCTGDTDSDCHQDCGDGDLDPGETCDGDCPADCDDGEACTVDTLVGSAANCDATCWHLPIEACLPNDGCCPEGCTGQDDSDCQAEKDGAVGGCHCASTSPGGGLGRLGLLGLPILIARRRNRHPPRRAR